jgi:hypothetical protein
MISHKGRYGTGSDVASVYSERFPTVPRGERVEGQLNPPLRLSVSLPKIRTGFNNTTGRSRAVETLEVSNRLEPEAAAGHPGGFGASLLERQYRIRG